MADNITLSLGSEDGPVVATDDVTSVHYPISKLAHGALDSVTLVSTSSGLPVQMQGTWNVTNAGTFAVQVDGAALTALQLLDDVVYVDDADWTDNTSKHALVGGVYQATPHTVTDGDVTPFLTDANGRMAVAVNGTVVVDLGANNDVTVTGTVDLGATDNAVLDAIAASVAAIDTDATTIIGHVDGIETLIGTTNTTLGTIDTDTGNIATNTATIAGAVSGTEMQVDVLTIAAGDNNIGNVDIASIAAGDNNIGNVDVVTLPALPAGTNNIGDVDVLTIAAGTNTIGDVGVKPRTSGGLTTAMASGSDGSSILVATAQAIKASAGQLFGYYLYNPEAAVTFVHFYNTAAASVTVGTTNPLFTLAIPAGSAANLMSDIGIAFSNAGWSWAATTTAGGNTAPATGVSAVAWYA